jgi:hypothetical protein
MRVHFPQYDYDDMVRSQYELLTQGMDVSHLRLILGTSMGCMHSWVWGENYPDFTDAMMPQKELSWRIWKPGTVMEKCGNYVTLLESGAGDGNRTRI